MRSWRGITTLYRHTELVSIVRSDLFKERPLYLYRETRPFQLQIFMAKIKIDHTALDNPAFSVRMREIIFSERSTPNHCAVLSGINLIARKSITARPGLTCARSS